MDIQKTSKEFIELKQTYDRARTSYEMAAKELENIEKDLKKRGFTIESVDSAIVNIKQEVDKKELALEKMMEKLGGIVAKIRKA